MRRSRQAQAFLSSLFCLWIQARLCHGLLVRYHDCRYGCLEYEPKVKCPDSIVHCEKLLHHNADHTVIIAATHRGIRMCHHNPSLPPLPNPYPVRLSRGCGVVYPAVQRGVVVDGGDSKNVIRLYGLHGWVNEHPHIISLSCHLERK